MSITQELFDRQVEHLIQSRRYSETARLLIEKESARHRKNLEKILRKDLKDRESLQWEVTRHVNELYSQSRSHINDFIGAELDFQTNSLKRGVKDWYRVQSVDRGSIAKLVTSQPLKLYKDGEKGTLETSFKSISKNTYTKINAKIRRGIAEGRPVPELIKEVHRTTRLTEAQAKTLVTTNLTQAEQIIKEKVQEANSDIISGFVFTAILDSRTSKICSSYDGLFQTAGSVKIRPPLHWNCRSSLVPALKSHTQLLQTDSPRINKGALSKVPPARLPGGQPAKENFEEWLRRQSVETKKKYFDTEEKMSLFEKGALNLSDFFSPKGNPISISALRAKDNLLTYFSPVRQIARDPSSLFLDVSRPFQLTRSKKLQKHLKDLIIADSANASQPLSLIDYRGTTIAGKKGVRHRANNVYDPRNQSFDPFTGEVRSTLTYDPDFTLYRERVDYMKESKVLDRKQKAFIEEFVSDLEDQVSVNQQTAIVENLRVVFERYNKKKVPWEDFVKVYRSEMNYSVINTSRLLDRRSRARSELFLGFKGDPGEPSVSIMGEMIPLAKLHEEKLKYFRYTQAWEAQEGRRLARELFYRGKAPWRAYLFKTDQKPGTLTEKLSESFKKRAIRSVFYKDDPVGFYTKYGKTPDKWSKIIKKHIEKKVKDSIPYYDFFTQLSDEGVKNFVTRSVREQYRSIVDLEFLFNSRRKTLADSLISRLEKKSRAESAINVVSNLMKVVAEGKTTDYDSLAILLGKELRSQWSPLVPFSGSSLQDYHEEGSKILEFFRSEGMLRVNARGVTRRATMDLDTLRPSGNWKDTVSREVQILDPDMLKLQDYNRRLELANRIGIDRPENRYYVVAHKKNYVDARGNDTGVPVITRSAYEKFDEKQLDKDFADMLNHTMSLEYQVDDQFSGFMDDLVRFKDQRGKAEHYDSLNAFREEIIRRGDQGYGLMETIRYYRSTGKSFRNNARIDGRGRVYYNGYLTATGGEVVRPFLNSAKATPMTPEGLHQIRIQMAAVIGPGTEALTDAGREAIFRRHEASILRIGEIMSHTTQRDRRIREFLDDPFVQSIEGEEIAKIARFSLEYYRIHKHTGGDFSSGHNKTVFGESHSDYKITQQRVEVYNPKVVYHEFWEEPETIAWAKSKGYTLKPGDLSYAQKEVLMKKYGGATEQFHRDREAFMLKQIKSADPSVRNAFVFGNDHVFDKNSVINKTKNIRKIDFKGKVINAEGDLLSTYKTQLMGEADASASGLQVIALSTGNRGAAFTSNVIPTTRKNRIYDLVAMDVVADPRFQKLMDELGFEMDWETVAKASKLTIVSR